MDDDETTTQGRGPRYLNFDAVTTRRVTITARGGRAFELRDDFPAHILLRYQILPTVEERSKQLLLELRDEARANGGASDEDGGDEGERTAEAFEARLRCELRESATLRQGVVRFARELDEDVLDICGDIFRFSYPALTDGELFGAWDEARMRWEGGVFSSEEARQIVELFTRLRGGGSSRPQPATERQPETTTSGTATEPTNRPQRRARKGAS